MCVRARVCLCARASRLCACVCACGAPSRFGARRALAKTRRRRLIGRRLFARPTSVAERCNLFARNATTHIPRSASASANKSKIMAVTRRRAAGNERDRQSARRSATCDKAPTSGLLIGRLASIVVVCGGAGHAGHDCRPAKFTRAAVPRDELPLANETLISKCQSRCGGRTSNLNLRAPVACRAARGLCN